MCDARTMIGEGIEVLAGEVLGIPTQRRHQNKRVEAILAPSLRLRSLAQTTSGATRPQPADVSKPQSVAASTAEGSPIVAATRSIRSDTTSGCSMILVNGSITPATRIW